MRKFNEFVGWAKDHKKEIAITTAGIAASAVVFAITKKKPEIPVEQIVKRFNNDLDKPEWNVGALTELWLEGEYINSIVEDFTIADLGKLGEEFLKVEGVTPETGVSAVISFLKEE